MSLRSSKRQRKASSRVPSSTNPSPAAPLLNSTLTRKLTTFNVYLHIKKLDKKPKNPSPAISEFPNPISKNFTLMSSLDQINKHIIKHATKDQVFLRSMMDFTEFDVDSNIFLFENNAQEEKISSSESDPRKILKTWTRHHISPSSAKEKDNQEIFKTIKKTSLRKKKIGEKDRLVLDVGIVMYKNDSSKRNSTTNSSSSSIVTPNKRKKKKEVEVDETPPDILRVKLMQPVWTDKKGVKINDGIAEIKEFDIDFKEFSRSSYSFEDKSDNDSTSSPNNNSNDKRKYLNSGIYGPVRAMVAKEILGTKSLICYKGRIGKKVSSIYYYYEYYTVYNY